MAAVYPPDICFLRITSRISYPASFFGHKSDQFAFISNVQRIEAKHLARGTTCGLTGMVHSWSSTITFDCPVISPASFPGRHASGHAAHGFALPPAFLYETVSGATVRLQVGLEAQSSRSERTAIPCHRLCLKNDHITRFCVGPGNTQPVWNTSQSRQC